MVSDTPIYTDDEGFIVVNFGGQSKAQTVMSKISREITEYPNGIDLASGYPKSQIWTTRDGRRIAIPNMKDSHLINTIKWMRSQVGRFKKQIACNALMKYTGQMMMFDFDIPDEVIEGHAEEFQKKCAELNKMPTDDFLRKYYPIYTHLLQEAYKRKLTL